MDIDTLRFLARFIGVPLCWILTLARWAGRLAHLNNRFPPPHKVLIIKLSEMGSTAWHILPLQSSRKRSEVELFFPVF
jgi:hypothetical protein